MRHGRRFASYRHVPPCATMYRASRCSGRPGGTSRTPGSSSLSLRQLGRRGAHSLIVLLGVSFVSFLLIHLVPGDPVRIALGPKAPEQQVIAVRHQLGLDQPLLQQYLDYLGNALRGDFGYSIQARVPVSDLVLPRIGPSLLLLGYASAISIL